MWWKAKRITPLDDHSAASWIQQGCPSKGGYRVGNVVPQGFEAYARVFHPASRYMPTGVGARWSGIASWTGRTRPRHAIPILGHPENPAIKPEWGSLPIEGSLDSDQIGVVIDVLTRRVCFFCIWEGWGEFGGPEIAYLPLELAGACRKVAKTICLGDSRGPNGCGLDTVHRPKRFWNGSPSLWWPQDRAWCVASDVDLTSTFVGGTEIPCLSLRRAHRVEFGLRAIPSNLNGRGRPRPPPQSPANPPQKPRSPH